MGSAFFFFRIFLTCENERCLNLMSPPKKCFVAYK